MGVTTSSIGLAFGLLTGYEAPFFSRSEVEGLLERARRAMALCKRWLPTDSYDGLADGVKQALQMLAGIAAQFPAGQGSLPATADLASFGITSPPERQLEVCAGCGNPAVQLRKCSACRAVAYCSVECQRQHWNRGGHKQQCTQLEASGAGTSRQR